jgi:deoxyribodipyrimidine photo-lyase
MSEPFVVALALEAQLRLDDQPALHQAVALARQRGQDQGQGQDHGQSQSQSQGKLIVLACRPQGQHLRGPHQRGLAAQALACLHRRLAAESIPLLHFPQHSTAAALELLAPLVRPQAVLHCQESRLFDDWPLAQESFPRVFAEFRRGLRQAPKPPLPVPDLGGLGGLRLEGPFGWHEPAGIDAAVAVAEAAGAGAGEAAGENWFADPRSAFPLFIVLPLVF